MVIREMGLKFLVINLLRREQLKILGGYCKTDCNEQCPEMLTGLSMLRYGSWWSPLNTVTNV
jgi:hypothetical protein